MDKDQMPKVNWTTDSNKINASNILLMQEIEKKNSERVKQLIKLRRSNRILGSLLGIAVFSIYFYTIYTVKQEKFLDDFKEPEKEIIPPKTNL
ncbi:cytochrome c oxidase assembly factor 3, mitochondrial [Polistes fuscatus]|uniref:cytochrome c oxidase assembly factor 3, mitochondrial n=1 Tax=Polistes fuscatus TaxID=30207 RepID=UPI001CA8CA35|nr:cytochrome c oxidase assembly factor 3, mitochondrial [Polistes fuscatus]